ncbi:hypothetical protein X777_04158 [Ooceraea biroi]|uniref:Uncharacterized protein n=1 Tax=Ooceraea biroi TaxID=2015173 RepID=A0A026WKW3_OOCBI|nr:hypothetical protein X777_04158 [Ooceraea biroi]
MTPDRTWRQFSMKRPDMLQIWMNAIGRDFIPKKSIAIQSCYEKFIG